jgi:thiamine-phosphate pyrophosphorylase
MKQISRLHYITTSATLAEAACEGGVDWIQLRLKDISYEAYKAAALEVQAVCKKYNATFIVNDSIKLALEIHADGVHVGKDDPLPYDSIVEMLARGGIIGCTVNTVEDFEHLVGKDVSYVGFGPFRYTETKKKLSPILGIEGYKKVFATLKEKGIAHAPVIGIGGVTLNDVPELLEAGCHGVAVSGAISNSEDITAAAKMFKSSVTHQLQ